MIQPDFSQFPVIHTERLILRRPAPADGADLFEMRSDPQVMQYIPRPLAKTPDDMPPFITMINDNIDRNERINWVMEWKDTGKVIGMIGYVNIAPQHSRAEVGYSLNRAWHRKGIMREALAAIVAHGFSDMQLHSIEAIIDADNIASGNLLKDVGFRQEALFLEDFFWDGQYRNSIHFGMLRTEWQARQTITASGHASSVS